MGVLRVLESIVKYILLHQLPTTPYLTIGLSGTTAGHVRYRGMTEGTTIYI
jgi:hypothetical protein